MNTDLTAADALVAWAEPNTVALEDPRLQAAVLRGLGGPTPDDLVDPRSTTTVPLLRYANHDLPALTLVEAIVAGTRHDHQVCDRCDGDQRSVNDRLWVPCGESVVEVAVCWRCKIDLVAPFRPEYTLVWN